MRFSLIEGLCLVAIGAAVVELHDGNHRFARPVIPSATAPATAAKPTAAAGQVRSPDTVNALSTAGYR